jgi:hypothetical protein
MPSCKKETLYKSFIFYGMTAKPEYEANIAAGILFGTNKLLEYIYRYGYTSEQIA